MTEVVGPHPGGVHLVEVANNPLTSAARGRIRDPSASAALLRMRIVFALVIGASIAVLPAFGERRVLLGVMIAVLAVVSDLHGLSVLARTEQPPATLGITDVVLTLTVVAAAPEAMPIATLIAAGGLTLHVLWYGRRQALLLALAYEAGLAVVAVAHQPPWWIATMIAFAIVAVASSVGLSDLAVAAENAHERYASMVNGLDAVVWEADGGGEVVFVSGNISEVLGTEPEEFARAGFYHSRVHPDDVRLLEKAGEPRPGGSADLRIRMRDDEGHYRWIQERQKVLLNTDGSVRVRRGVVVDETERWEAESDLRRYMDFISGIPVALVVLRLADTDDPNSIEVVLRNPAAEALVPSAEGERLVDALPLDQDSLEALAEVARGSGTMERPFVKFPGSDAVFAVRAVSLPEHHVGLTVEDITKRARLADSFRHQALHDELTGLPNRAHLRERLVDTMSGPEPPSVALLLVDLDQFKEINDTLGHHYGDRLLREFAQRLAKNLRGCDTIARLGGDEFAILLTDGPSESNSIEVAERLLRLCTRRFMVDDFRFHVGASVGIALAPDHASDPEALLRKADTAMYWAKQRGGGWSMYSDLHDDRDVRRLQLTSDLRDAVSEGQLEVHYQPRISLTDGTMTGLEALVRWDHPVHGLLPPDEFIELAEVSGAIRELTRFVTARALEETADLLDDRSLCLSVNLSTRSLHDPGLLDWLGEALSTATPGSGQLCFEITETELMEDPVRAMDTLESIRSMGVRFSVDDFGTGYSSLAYLQRLPVDEVKIDRSFVAELERDDTIVRAVIDLAHNLGLRVVAEGVEELGMEKRLRELGCDSAQGFLWCTPMPYRELCEWVASHPVPVQLG